MPFMSLISGKIEDLQIEGKFTFKEILFKTNDFSSLIVDAVNSNISKLAKKVPALKGYKLTYLENFQARYKGVTSDFSLSKGVFSIPSFQLNAYPNAGVDLSGSLRADLLRDELNVKLNIRDSYDISGVSKVSATIAGVKVNRILMKGDEAFSIPVTVGCKLSSPCYDYNEVGEYLYKIALANVGDVFKNEFKANEGKIREKIKEEIEKGVQELKKKFKF
jgi:hypothetical protein